VRFADPGLHFSLRHFLQDFSALNSHWTVKGILLVI